MIKISIVISILSIASWAKAQVDYLKEDEVQLSTPQIYAQAVLFNDSCVICTTIVDKSEAHVNVDGKEVKLDAKGCAIVKSSSKISSYLTSDDYLNSDTAYLEVMSLKGSKAIHLAPITVAGSDYNHLDLDILYDNLKGTANFKDDRWIGYRDSIVQFHLTIKEKTPINTVTVSYMNASSSWIFPPRKVCLQAIDGKHVICRQVVFKAEDVTSHAHFVTADFSNFEGHDFILTLHSFGELPVGHPGAGDMSWLFIDEIIIK